MPTDPLPQADILVPRDREGAQFNGRAFHSSLKPLSGTCLDLDITDYEETSSAFLNQNQLSSKWEKDGSFLWRHAKLRLLFNILTILSRNRLLLKMLNTIFLSFKLFTICLLRDTGHQWYCYLTLLVVCLQMWQSIKKCCVYAVLYWDSYPSISAISNKQKSQTLPSIV